MTDLDPKILKQTIEASGLKFKKSAASFIFDCPRCEKKDKLYIRRKDGAFICFYCAETEGFKGRCDYALAELMGLPLQEVRTLLFGSNNRVFKENLLNIKLTLDGFEREEAQPIEMPADFFPIDSEWAQKGMAYVNSRGIPAEIAKEYGLMFNRASQRVIFPVLAKGKLYGYQARTIGRAEPKILTSTGLLRDRLVMFQDRLAQSPHAVICEGPVDAIKAHGCGGNIATMGKIVAEGQIRLIMAAGVKRIYLALDPDAGEEISLLAQKIGSEVELYHLVPAPGFKDLGEMSFDAVYGQFLKAERVYPNTLFLTLKG